MFVTEPKTATANKRHQCHWCGEWIEIGERYERWFSAYPGQGGVTTKAHVECSKAWTEAATRWPDEYIDGIGFGEHCRGRVFCEPGKCGCDESLFSGCS